MKSNCKPLLLLAILFSLSQTSCFKGIIAKQIKNSVELEVRRDYSAAYDSIPGHFFADKGLDSLFKTMKENATLNIVLTHGLGSTKVDHFDDFKNQLAKGLAYKEDKPDTDTLIIDQCDTNFILGRPFIVKSDYKIGKKHLRIFDVEWSPITAKAKGIVIALNDSPHSSVLTKNSKNNLLTDVFGDLALYQNGEFDECIKKPLDEIIRHLNKNSGPVDSIVLIGGSFGNELFLNILGSLPQGEKANLAGEANKFARIYMLSNQLPFTAFMSLPENMKKSQADFTKHIYRDLNGTTQKPPFIISFYDPNDVFGYRLPDPKLAGLPNLIVQNVKVKNTMEWSFNPDKVREKYIGGVKNTKMRSALKNLLYQDTSRQNIKVDLTGPNVSAKENLAVIGVIIKGREYLKMSFNGSFPFIKHDSVINKDKKVMVGNGKHQTKQDSIEIKKEKNGCYFIKRISKYFMEKRINQMGVSDAPLPFEFPSKDFQSADNGITGIHESISDNQVTNIVTLHGMRSKKLDHFDDLMFGLVRNLGFNPTPVRDTVIKINNGQDNTVSGRMSIHIKEFVNLDGKMIRFFVLYWSSLTSPAKSLLQEMDSAVDSRAEMSFTNDLFKKMVINDGLTDVLLTTNTFSNSIHKLLNSAFKLLETMPTANTTSKDTYLVTGSLGSQLMLDFLKDSLATPNVQRLLNRTGHFYMLTNQLPFLALKNVKNNTTDTSDFINQIYGGLKDKPLTIIAFNDPNDVLGFALPKPVKGSQLSVINVSLNIAEGISLRKFQTLKNTEYMDKIFKRMIKRDLLREHRKLVKAAISKTNDDKDLEKFWKDKIVEDMKLNKKDHKRFLSSKFFRLLEENENTKQTFVVRIDTAHEAPSEDERVLQIMSFGTHRLPKSRVEQPNPPSASY